MTTKAWAREMTLYTKWQEETQFGLCETLSDAERKRDNGLFFGSIHHTLDHILMVDGRLLRYVVDGQGPSEPFEPGRIVHADYDALKQAPLRLHRRPTDADRRAARLLAGRNDYAPRRPSGPRAHGAAAVLHGADLQPRHPSPLAGDVRAAPHGHRLRQHRHPLQPAVAILEGLIGPNKRHCEERRDAAIHRSRIGERADRRASLAMTAGWIGFQ